MNAFPESSWKQIKKTKLFAIKDGASLIIQVGDIHHTETNMFDQQCNCLSTFLHDRCYHSCEINIFVAMGLLFYIMQDTYKYCVRLYSENSLQKVQQLTFNGFGKLAEHMTEIHAKNSKKWPVHPGLHNMHPLHLHSSSRCCSI